MRLLEKDAQKNCLSPKKMNQKKICNIDKKSSTTEMRDLGEKPAEDFDSIKRASFRRKRHTDEVSG